MTVAEHPEFVTVRWTDLVNLLDDPDSDARHHVSAAMQDAYDSWLKGPPGARLATDETGEARVKIDTLPFVVAPGRYSGKDVRHFMHPPLGRDRDLWVEDREFGEDVFVEDDTVLDIVDDTRFYTAPRMINGG